MRNKVIVIISPDDWNFIHLSKHHYAILLAKQNEVYFVNPPNSGNEDFVDSNVKVINSYRNIRGLNRLPSKVLIKEVMKFEINSILKIINKPLDIVWSFDSSRLYFLDLFKTNIRIAHLVDLSENFYLEELTSSSTISFATSDSIIDNIKKYQSKVFKIDHGFRKFEATQNLALPGCNSIKGVYVGNLNIKYIDWEIIKFISIEKPEIDFIFIGPHSDALKEQIEAFNTNRNIYLLPKVKSDLIPSYLAAADFCLLVYKSKEYYQQLQNPHKIMQYLGSGKPIFATLTHEYIGKDLLFMIGHEENAVACFEQFLIKLGSRKSDEQTNKRVTYALQNTYENQLAKIEKLLEL